MIGTYLSLEHIAILLFALIMILFSMGTVWLNIEKDKKNE
tara:strand:- start:931 stop:1050 length:120 start_codon:yes stop_codon:yes gene_type:complete